jgi:hypothetical protein
MVVQRYGEGEGDVSGFAFMSRAEPEGEKQVVVRLSSSSANNQWGGENSGEKEGVLRDVLTSRVEELEKDLTRLEQAWAAVGEKSETEEKVCQGTSFMMCHDEHAVADDARSIAKPVAPITAAIPIVLIVLATVFHSASKF